MDVWTDWTLLLVIGMKRLKEYLLCSLQPHTIYAMGLRPRQYGNSLPQL